MRRGIFVLGVIFVFITLSTPAEAQFGFGGKKTKLQRMLPPVVELEARSFSIEATSQDRAADPIAASFQEAFRAKIQGDQRFVYDAVNPALRISIVVTRYYVEPKQLTTTDAKTTCTTYTGSLQGTFRVIEVSSGRPLASDTIGWNIQVGRTKHWLVAEDGRELNIKGPNEKLTLQDVWSEFEPDGLTANVRRLPWPGGNKSPHPCNLPLSQNEARDVLADAFMAEIIQMSLPYSIDAETSIRSNGPISRAVEEAMAGEWSKALDGALAAKELPKADEESERLYLIALAYEALGYKDGERAFEVGKKIQAGLPAGELVTQQAELRRIVDLAKERFDKASSHYNLANKKKAEEDYRSGERRADQSRRLYARIQRYRDLKTEPAKPAASAAKLRMAEVLGMCAKGLDESIIVYRVETVAEIEISPAEFEGLSQCGDKQKAIFQALRKRLDAAKPAAPPRKPTTQPAAPKTPAAKPATLKPPSSPPPAPRPTPGR